MNTRRVQRVPLCPTMIKTASHCTAGRIQNEQQHGMKLPKEMQNVPGIRKCRGRQHHRGGIDCAPNMTRVSKKEPNREDGSEEFRNKLRSSKRKRKSEEADNITDMTPATKRRTLNADGDKPDLVLHPAPPQTSESVALDSVSSQAVRHCFKPIKTEPPDEPVMGDVTPPDGEDKPELVLSVHPAPPQTSESVALVSVSSQTVQHCLKPIKTEPPDEPVMGDVTPPDGEAKPELVLSVHPAPPQTSESGALVSVSSQTVQHCLKPIKTEPPDEPDHTDPVHDLQNHTGLFYTCSEVNTGRSIGSGRA